GKWRSHVRREARIADGDVEGRAMYPQGEPEIHHPPDDPAYEQLHRRALRHDLERAPFKSPRIVHGRPAMVDPLDRSGSVDRLRFQRHIPAPCSNRGATDHDYCRYAGGRRLSTFHCPVWAMREFKRT